MCNTKAWEWVWQMLEGAPITSYRNVLFQHTLWLLTASSENLLRAFFGHGAWLAGQKELAVGGNVLKKREMQLWAWCVRWLQFRWKLQMTFVKQRATWPKVEERIRKICVGDSAHIELAGAGIIESRFGKGKWTQIWQGFGWQGEAMSSKHCSKLPTIFSLIRCSGIPTGLLESICTAYNRGSDILKKLLN